MNTQKPALRIVGGTAYRAPDGAAVSPAKQEAPAKPKAAPAARKQRGQLPDTPENIAAARAAVLSCVLPDGTTVGAALRWLQGGYEVFDDEVQGEIGLNLLHVGIADNSFPEEGYDALGYINNLTCLLESYPVLATYAAILARHPALPV